LSARYAAGNSLLLIDGSLVVLPPLDPSLQGGGSAQCFTLKPVFNVIAAICAMRAFSSPLSLAGRGSTGTKWRQQAAPAANTKPQIQNNPEGGIPSGPLEVLKMKQIRWVEV
jgi:hypothetical protein